MKDEWLGDEGDFLKLGFLRALTAATDDLLPLGILWYYRRSRYPSRGPADKPARLTHSRWREFDPHLFDYLASLWERGARNLQTVTREHLLGSGVIHFLDDLESPAEPVRVTRPRWCARALEVVGDCRTVFFDPDNGVQPDPGPRLDYTKSRLPHALWSEVEAIWNRGSSLIAFQHAPRMRSAEATVTPLPAEKKNHDVYYYVAKASPHRPVRSSIPEVTNEANAAARRATNLTRVGLIGLIVGVATFFGVLWQALGVVRDANEALEGQREQIILLEQSVEDLQEQAETMGDDIVAPPGEEPAGTPQE